MPAHPKESPSAPRSCPPTPQYLQLQSFLGQRNVPCAKQQLPWTCCNPVQSAPRKFAPRLACLRTHRSAPPVPSPLLLMRTLPATSSSPLKHQNTLNDLDDADDSDGRPKPEPESDDDPPLRHPLVNLLNGIACRIHCENVSCHKKSSKGVKGSQGQRSHSNKIPCGL